MLLRNLIPFLFLCAAILPGCGLVGSDDGHPFVCTDNQQDVTSSDVLRPLSVDNFWRYDILRDGPPEDSVRLSVTARTSFPEYPDLQTYELTWVGPGNRDGANKELWANTEGHHSFLGRILPSDTLLIDYLELPYPTFEGDYTYEYAIEFDEAQDRWVKHDSLRYTVVEVNTLIDTPAGEFNTFVYRYYFQPLPDVGGYYVYQYFSPGIGLVAQKRWTIGADIAGDEPYFQMVLTYFCVRDP